MRPYTTVKDASEVELVINKSRFIGRCFPVKSEEEALALLNALRKQHWDANHNCFAYRLGEGADIARFSDDGEPGGTAGMPIMEVLSANALTNVLCVVTRYFGGVLLGAGGLVRAYSKAAAQAVSRAGVVHMLAARRVRLTVDYARYASLERHVRERTDALIEDISFLETVTLTALVEQEKLDAFVSGVIEKTDGRVVPELLEEAYLPRPKFELS